MDKLYPPTEKTQNTGKYDERSLKRGVFRKVGRAVFKKTGCEKSKNAAVGEKKTPPAENKKNPWRVNNGHGVDVWLDTGLAVGISINMSSNPVLKIRGLSKLSYTKNKTRRTSFALLMIWFLILD